MTKSTITRERVVALIAEHSYDSALVDALEHLLAAMDSEPVAWTDEQELRDVDRGGCGYLFTVNPVTPHADERRIILLYRHAQPASEREQVRQEHAEWSQTTFGNVGPIGPLKHLSKEALEAAEQPDDLSEWADMQFLLWDAQRRAGITDEQITQAMIEKLAVNKQREWPEPKNGEPRLHIKAQPAPVTEREPIAWLNDAYLARGVVDGEAGSEDAGPGYIPVYREAQSVPVVQCPFPCGWDNLNKLAIQDAALVARGLVEDELTTEAQRQAAILNNDRLLKVISACRAAMLQAGNCRENENSSTNNFREIAETSTNSSVIPDGYVMVPKEPTAEMQSAGASAIRIETTALNKPWTGNAVFRAMLAAAPQEVKP